MSDPIATPEQIHLLKACIDAGEALDPQLAQDPAFAAFLEHGWLERADTGSRVTEAGWHVLKRDDGVES